MLYIIIYASDKLIIYAYRVQYRQQLTIGISIRKKNRENTLNIFN